MSRDVAIQEWMRAWAWCRQAGQRDDGSGTFYPPRSRREEALALEAMAAARREATS